MHHFGATIFPQYTTWDDLKAVALRLDAAGYDSLWHWDHFQPILGNRTGPNFEGWQLLPAYAALTRRIKIGMLVSGNTHRHPAVLANMAATLDHISNGRAVLGIGAAWCESEHKEYGLDFGPSPGHRIARLSEALPIIRSMFDNPRTTLEGQHYQVREALCEPKPIQAHLPIMIGAAGENKMLRLVARYADYWNAFGPPDVMGRKVALLREYCAEAGTDFNRILTTVTMNVIIRDTEAAVQARRDEIQAHHRIARWRPNHIPVGGTPDVIARAVLEYSKVGIQGCILGLPAPFDFETVDRFQSEVVPLLASSL